MLWLERREDGRKGGADPGPEGGDVGEDVEAASFGEEAVVWCDQDGGVVVGVVEDPGRRVWLARVMSVDETFTIIPRRPPVWEHPRAGEQEAAMPADNYRTLARDSCLRGKDGALYSVVIDCFVGAVCDVEVCESVGRRGRLGVCHDDSYCSVLRWCQVVDASQTSGKRL